MVIRIWFAVASIAVVLMLIVAAVTDYRTEWREYQQQYKARALSKERVFSVRELLQEMPVAIQQEYLEGLGRIDRCMTCHLGIENPKMEGEPQPFTVHPGTLLENHRPQAFGCTVCHGGQGLATTTADAHGFVPHWEQPLREPEQIEAACGSCHHERELAAAPQLSLGRGLFANLGCVGCHRVAGRGLNIGPDLSHVASKDFTGDGRVDMKDWEWNVEHLLDPKSRVESSFMPSFNLQRQQAMALTVFLYSLSGDVIPTTYLPRAPAEIATHTRVEAGRQVFVEYGCAGCHGPQGEGGILNPNSQSGGQVSALAKVKEGYLREELIERIKTGVRTEKAVPEGPDPPLNMPAWKGQIADDRLDLLVDYLFSLAPEDAGEDDWDD